MISTENYVGMSRQMWVTTWQADLQNERGRSGIQENAMISALCIVQCLVTDEIEPIRHAPSKYLRSDGGGNRYSAL